MEWLIKKKKKPHLPVPAGEDDPRPVLPQASLQGLFSRRQRDRQRTGWVGTSAPRVHSYRNVWKSNPRWNLSRCEGDVSGSDGDRAQARQQSGHPLLRDEFTAQLVQRWENLTCTCNSVQLAPSLAFLHSWRPCFCHKGDDPRKEMHPIVTAMFGATAGAASVFGNTPLDVVKTRMQVGKTTWAAGLCVISITGCFRITALFSCEGVRGSPLQKHSGLCLPDPQTRRTAGVSQSASSSGVSISPLVHVFWSIALKWGDGNTELWKQTSLKENTCFICVLKVFFFFMTSERVKCPNLATKRHLLKQVTRLQTLNSQVQQVHKIQATAAELRRSCQRAHIAPYFLQDEIVCCQSEAYFCLVMATSCFITAMFDNVPSLPPSGKTIVVYLLQICISSSEYLLYPWELILPDLVVPTASTRERFPGSAVCAWTWP